MLGAGAFPAILTDAGLGAALEHLAEGADLPVTVRVAQLGALPAGVEAATYFVAAEALANVTKHAAATRMTITVGRIDHDVTVEVADDGVGGADATLGSGLRGLADRLDALGGRLSIDSPAGGGTRLTATIPITEPTSG